MHGTRKPDHNELWSYGPEAQNILIKYDSPALQLDAVYLLAGVEDHERGLHADASAGNGFSYRCARAEHRRQYMYGPAFLVNPVTEQGATPGIFICRMRNGIDFWEGKVVKGGRAIDAPAPLDRMPLYVRAGSIVPLGPDVEYATEKPADPVEVRVYPGANGDFTLYEDENDNYNYEKGVYATIPMHWDDATGVLTIGDRKGSFPGMLQTRTFRVLFVGTGVSRTAPYSGKSVSIAR